MKKISKGLKKDIKLLSLGKLSIFKENREDFKQLRKQVMREHNVSGATIEREMKKIRKGKDK
jgi:hypothetical protein